MAGPVLTGPAFCPPLRDKLPAEGHSLSLEETGRILLVLELRFLMAIVSFGGKR